MKTQEMIEKEAAGGLAPATSATTVQGPRDPRETAFVTALTDSSTTPLERQVVRAGQLFLVASAGFVVLAAVYATMVG